MAAFWGNVKAAGTEAWTAIKSAASGIGSAIGKVLGLSESDGAKLEKDLLEPFRRAIEAIRDLLTNVLPSVISSGLGSVADALETMVSRIEAAVDRIIAAVERAKAAAAEMPSGGSSGGGSDDDSGFARGGFVRGPGSSTSDSIRAWLSSGEFVLNAAAVRRIGVGALKKLNALGLPGGKMRARPRILGGERFSMGGLVGDSLRAISPPTAFAGAGSSAERVATINLTIGGETFENLTAPEEVATRLAKAAAAQSMRRAGKTPSYYRG
jgi:hypothetical protein